MTSTIVSQDGLPVPVGPRGAKVREAGVFGEQNAGASASGLPFAEVLTTLSRVAPVAQEAPKLAAVDIPQPPNGVGVGLSIDVPPFGFDVGRERVTLTAAEGTGEGSSEIMSDIAGVSVEQNLGPPVQQVPSIWASLTQFAERPEAAVETPAAPAEPDAVTPRIAPSAATGLPALTQVIAQGLGVETLDGDVATLPSVTVTSQATHFAPVVDPIWMTKSDKAAQSLNVPAASPALSPSGNALGDAGGADDRTQSDRPVSLAALAMLSRSENGATYGAGSNGSGSNSGAASREFMEANVAAAADVSAPFEVSAPAVPSAVTASPTRQIIDKIGQSLVEAATAPPLETPTLAKVSATGSALRLLEIQLQPADLGVVTIRMAWKDDALEIQIAPHVQATAERLQQDSEMLAGVLRGAGYTIDQGSIEIIAPDQNGGARQDASASGSNGQGQPMRSGEQSGEQGRRSNRSPDDNGAGRRDSELAASTAPVGLQGRARLGQETYL